MAEIPNCIEEIPANLPKRKAFVVLRDLDGIPCHFNIWDVSEYGELYVLTHPEIESAIVVEPGASSTITYLDEINALD